MKLLKTLALGIGLTASLFFIKNNSMTTRSRELLNTAQQNMQSVKIKRQTILLGLR